MNKKKIKRMHDIYLSEEGNGDDKITIKGNSLNCRWFDNCILVWSDKTNKNPLPKKCLEIIEDTFKEELQKQRSELK